MALGLVLSGGGIKAGAHIGVLKALHENGIKPDVVSGTSAGAIVAGLYAYGYTPEEIGLIGNRLAKRYYDVDYPGILSSIFSFMCQGTLTIDGLIKGNIIESYMHRLTKGTKIRDAKIPVAITAVDINNTNIVVFTSCMERLLWRDDFLFVTDSSFAEAIRASIAIPGVFKPKIYRNMRLVDGGIRANLPVEIVRRIGAEKVIAVNLSYSGYPVPGVSDILEISLQAIELMVFQITRPSIESANIIISPVIHEVKQREMGKIDYIIDCGYRATKSIMPKIKKLIN